MPVKMELHQVSVSVTTITLDEEDEGRIPVNLAKLTETVIGLHKANGDLAWVQDVARDAELCKYAVLPYELPIEETENTRTAPSGK